MWLAFPTFKRGLLGVLSRLVEQQGRKATQASSGRRRCANLPRGEPSRSSSPLCLALWAAPRNARTGRIRPGRWPMGRAMESLLVSRCLVAGGTGLPPPGGGSSVDDHHTSAGTMDAVARGQRNLFQPLPLGLDPTGLRPPTGVPSGSTHLKAAPSSDGTHHGE